MPKLDPRVDAYIKRAKPFAQPILVHLRKVVHEACPGVEEGVKWGVPHCDYKGPFCGMAAFTTFAPGRRREYVEWVLDAKQDATRAKRIADAVAWMAEGKIRNWKYTK